MSTPVKTIAAVQGASSAAAQDIFRALAARLQPSVRIAGLLEEGHGQDDQVCGAGYLRCIGSGARYPMFQDLEHGSKACRIDPAGVLVAGEAVRRDIAAGCDLVLLSRFAKLEAAHEGLMPAFATALQAGVPLLTSVSPAFRDAWERFASPLFVVLPAEPEAVDDWWHAVRSNTLQTARLA